MQDSEIFTHKKTIHCWIDPNLCTKDDLAKLKDLIKTDYIGFCDRERVNTTWRFYRLTYLTVFAALLKDAPMGCKDAVLPEPVLQNYIVHCVTDEQNRRQPDNHNLYLFRALVPHLQGNQRLEEETSKNFNSFKNRMEGQSIQRSPEEQNSTC